jgi:hypothetical protein
MGLTIPIRQAKDQTEADLIRHGWQKQTTLEEPRLGEVAEGYRAMGYEVYVQSFQSAEGCNTCFETGAQMGRTYGTVWIRQTGGARLDDELFD